MKRGPMDFLIAEALERKAEVDAILNQENPQYDDKIIDCTGKNKKNKLEDIDNNEYLTSLEKKHSETNKPKKQVDPNKLVAWFSELNKTSGNIAGGKGANLAEIYNFGIPVPPGFVITAQAYSHFIKNAGIDQKIQELLSGINYENTKELDEKTQKVRTLIINADFSEKLKEDIEEAYDSLDTTGIENMGKGSALDIFKNAAEPVFVAVRSSATAEDLADASFAGQQDSFLNIKGKTDLLKHIKKCFASLFTSRATYYRNKKGFDHNKVQLAVVVQKMVDSDKSGVIFSKDPTYKNNNIIIEAVWGLGEGIVSGQITPDKYLLNPELEIIDKKISMKKIAITRDSSGNKTVVKLISERANAQVLKEHEIKKLAELAQKLEEHYEKPQDIEFAIEGTNLFIVQTRPITTIESRIEKQGSSQENGEEILSGLAASPGVASGKVKIIKGMEDLEKIKEGDVLVTEMTNPDMVVTMQRASAIVTDEGGLTSHAAIVSREMGIPAIVGTETATETLKEGEIITVDGFQGKVYRGSSETSQVPASVKKEVEKVTSKTNTKIKVIVDLPTFAERAAKTGLDSVGLTRIEGIIAESGKHPNYYIENGGMEEYENTIYKGIKGIANHFKSIWVRTSDIRSDEYKNLKGAPQEPEGNPMLGDHGIRYSLKHPEILKAELRAMSRITNEGTEIGILLPQLILVDELKKVKEYIKELNAEKLKLGVMIETPAAIQIIKDLCEEGIKFISFGTNDLTQYILAIDRNNPGVQDLYDEMHPAVLFQLAYVIRTCKKHNVETSICGQAASKKEMVKYLVEQKIDGLSVNADAAQEIAEYVAELEKEKGESPRQYQPEEKKQETEQNDNSQTENNSEEKTNLDIY